MRRRAKPPPHPADPPTTTNRHTNAHLLSETTTRLRGVKRVVEAGTANSAFAKGGRCPTVRQPLSTWAPGLHPTDEPLVLCQPFLIALIGRQRALSTPIRENFWPRLCRPAWRSLEPRSRSMGSVASEWLEEASRESGGGGRACRSPGRFGLSEEPRQGRAAGAGRRPGPGGRRRRCKRVGAVRTPPRKALHPSRSCEGTQRRAGRPGRMATNAFGAPRRRGRSLFAPSAPRDVI
jgi:hypothetical protein